MAFKVAQTPTYKTKVTVVIPNDQGGNTSSDFNVVFKRFTVVELEGANPDLSQLSDKPPLKAMQQADVMRKAIAGWDGLENDDGEKLEFTPENLEIVISIPQALKALYEAFWLTQYSAKQKN